MAVPTKPMPGGSAVNMAGSLAQLKVVPRMYRQEACAKGMEQMASVKKRTAHQMLSRKVATVVRTVERMGSAFNQVATRHAFQDHPSAPSMVRTGSAQCTGVKLTQQEEARSV